MSLRIKLPVCACTLLLLAAQARAYEISVHRAISEQAFDQSVLAAGKGDYLITLGIASTQLLQGSVPQEWFSNGSDYEDSKCCLRPFNHFYDPTTGNSLLNLPDFIATDSLNWGLELRSTGTLTQDWSIPDARSYFLRGLTEPDPSVREENLGKTFRALGHAIHLIQDMAQPQHVRNDPHLHTGISILDWDESRYEDYTDQYRKSLSYTGYNTVGFTDFGSYWDAHDGRGISEVTNHNFFSERYSILCDGDICAEEGYAQPTISLASGVDLLLAFTRLDETTGEGTFTFFPHSFIDPITGETVTNPKVLTYSLFDLDLIDRGQGPIFSQNIFTFEETARILIKRAVGYSAGLINYFFRGKLNFEKNPDLGAGGYLIRNQSAEEMGGTFTLYYDAADGLRHPVLGGSWPMTISAGQTSDPLYFAPPSDPAPGEEGLYTLVFTGQMGNEGQSANSPGAVVGKRTTVVRAISAGTFHSCAVLSNGAILCWGANDTGELGRGTSDDGSPNPIPGPVTGINTATDVSAHGGHTCALLSDASVRCWGSNNRGQLGIGTAIGPETCLGSHPCSTIPVKVVGISNAVAVSAGFSHTCALLDDGTIKCWGRNESGQIGSATVPFGGSAIVTTPTTVDGISTAVAVSSGDRHTCALLSNGTVRCWGSNSVGQLGNGSTTFSRTPVVVSGISAAVAVSTGGRHSCAALSDRTLQCWGDNFFGQLGYGLSTPNYSPVPVTITALSGVVRVTTGSAHACAILSDATAKCWGENAFGEIGNGGADTVPEPFTGIAVNPVPVPVLGVSNVSSISAAGQFTCAIADGTVQCWGDNEFGQVANDGMFGIVSVPAGVIGL